MATFFKLFRVHNEQLCSIIAVGRHRLYYPIEQYLIDKHGIGFFVLKDLKTAVKYKRELQSFGLPGTLIVPVESYWSVVKRHEVICGNPLDEKSLDEYHIARKEGRKTEHGIRGLYKHLALDRMDDDSLIVDSLMIPKQEARSFLEIGGYRLVGNKVLPNSERY